MTIALHPGEYKLQNEKLLFQEYVTFLLSFSLCLTEESFEYRKILADGSEHALQVLEDEDSGGVRLLASVWTGEMQNVPVWTAFGTYIT